MKNNLYSLAPQDIKNVGACSECTKYANNTIKKSSLKHESVKTIKLIWKMFFFFVFIVHVCIVFNGAIFFTVYYVHIIILH